MPISVRDLESIVQTMSSNTRYVSDYHSVPPNEQVNSTVPGTTDPQQNLLKKNEWVQMFAYKEN